jgi:CheY-like chemotaxis protein
MSPRTLRILLVEDNLSDALLVELALEEIVAFVAQVLHVESLEEAREELQKGTFDLALID